MLVSKVCFFLQQFRIDTTLFLSRADVENIFLDCLLNSVDEICENDEKIAATNFFRIMSRFSRNNQNCGDDHFFVKFPKFIEYFSY